MPECTEEERALLDTLAQRPVPNDGLREACAQWALTRVSPELKERLVSAMAAGRQAGKAEAACWAELDALGLNDGTTKTWNDFYKAVEAEAEKRLSQ